MLHNELATIIPLIVDKRTNIKSLACVLIDAKAKTITMTDMDIYAVISNVDITGKASMMIDAYALYAIAKATKKSFAMTMMDDGIDIISDGDLYKLPKQCEVRDFPEVSPISGYTKHTTAIDVPTSLFKVNFCASTEATRYYLNGVHLVAQGNELKAIATDGHRLALRQATVALDGKGFEGKENIIVPSKTVRAIQKLAKDKMALSLCQPAKGNGGVCKISLQVENIFLVSKLIDGNFPDWHRVVPDKAKATVSFPIDGKELARICSKRAIVDSKYAQMFGGSTGYWIRLEGQKSMLEKKLSEKPLKTAFNVGFNLAYMDDIIDDMESGSAEVHIIDGRSPMRIENAGNLYVLMPARVPDAKTMAA